MLFFFAIQSLQVNTENRMTQLKYTEICDSICRYCHAVQTHRRWIETILQRSVIVYFNLEVRSRITLTPQNNISELISNLKSGLPGRGDYGHGNHYLQISWYFNHFHVRFQRCILYIWYTFVYVIVCAVYVWYVFIIIHIYIYPLLSWQNFQSISKSFVFTPRHLALCRDDHPPPGEGEIYLEISFFNFGKRWGLR